MAQRSMLHDLLLGAAAIAAATSGVPAPALLPAGSADTADTADGAAGRPTADDADQAEPSVLPAPAADTESSR
jgi:hypothetical protein